ncbi:C-signal [Procambarus clarkii]|uniref:C-signal n=1 Tax=Procambarus clarkii TaxID=6728 RepID=UPI003741ED5D
MLAESVLITGCSRGLGLEMVRQLVTSDSAPRVVLATCRNPDSAKELQGLARDHSCLKIIKFDVVDYESLPGLVAQVQEAVGAGGLNVLINNAAIIDTCSSQVFGVPLEQLEPQMVNNILETNTTAPLMLIKALLPLLRQAGGRAGKPLSVQRAAVVNISAFLASMGAYLSMPDVYGYRASKAAINVLTKSLSVEYDKDGILFVAVHPGWVQTDMGTSAAPLTAQESISKVFQVLTGLSEKHNGLMISYTGDILPW